MGNQDKHCYQCKHRHKLYCEKPCNACNGNPNVVKGKDNFTELETANKMQYSLKQKNSILPLNQVVKAQDFDSCIVGSNPTGVVQVFNYTCAFTGLIGLLALSPPFTS